MLLVPLGVTYVSHAMGLRVSGGPMQVTLKSKGDTCFEAKLIVKGRPRSIAAAPGPMGARKPEEALLVPIQRDQMTAPELAQLR